MCRKYKILLLEDDAYFHLSWDHGKRGKSYFELEAEDDGGKGLVLRFDSMSKILSSGGRLSDCSHFRIAFILILSD